MEICQLSDKSKTDFIRLDFSTTVEMTDEYAFLCTINITSK